MESHFGVRWNQNGAKSEPKGNQTASTNHDRKKVPQSAHPGYCFLIFWRQLADFGCHCVSGRPPTHFDTGRWGQLIISKVLAESGGEESLILKKEKHQLEPKGYPKDTKSQPMGDQSTSIN